MSRMDIAKEVVNRAKRAGEVLLGRDEPPADAPPPPPDADELYGRMDNMERLLQRVEAEIAKVTRHKDEYFVLLEKMERQRDEWRELYHTQSRTHHNAQVLLESHLMQCREWLGKVIRIANEYRKAENKSQILKPADLDAESPPVGTAAEYDKAMKQLAAGAEPLLDVKLERDKIDEAEARHFAVMCTCGHARIEHATDDRNCVYADGCPCSRFVAAT